MDEMDPHVAAGIYGTPKINPDEQRKYLGTFRERVYAAQTVATMTEDQYLSVWQEELRNHPDGTLLINGHLPQETLDRYMKLASQAHVGFSMITSEDYKADPDKIGAELVAKEAVNVDQIDITKMQPAQPEAVAETPKKKSLFGKLFG
jgi:uncharacterized protein YueI